MTLMKQFGDFQKDTPAERNIRYGVREHGMGAIANGIALHSPGFKSYVTNGAHAANGKCDVSTNEQKAAHERGMRSGGSSLAQQVSQARQRSPPEMKLPVDKQRATAEPKSPKCFVIS